MALLYSHDSKIAHLITVIQLIHDKSSLLNFTLFILF